MAALDLNIPTTKLPDGHAIPQLAYGTGTAWYNSAASSTRNQELIDSIKLAIQMGYHHVDAAEMYNNEEEVGSAIAASKVPREKLFVTTKIHHRSINDIPGACDTALKKLGLDYLDMYLIHFPYFGGGDPAALQTAWAQMEELVASGKTRSIGVSNFQRNHLDTILQTAKVRPAVNQIEFHPYNQHSELYDYCKNQDIKLEAYNPLAPVTKVKGGPLDEVLSRLSKKYAVNEAEILLRWTMDRDVIAITTSSKEQRLSDYLRALTVDMTPKEIDEISEVGKGHYFQAFDAEKIATMEIPYRSTSWFAGLI